MDESDKRELLRTMQRIREFESEVQTRFRDGEMPGFVHLYIGEEAVATGVCQALSESDYITSTHRGHGHCIARGLEMTRMMAELYGKRTGYCEGKGGSMHIADTDAGMLGANGIVAAGLPIAAGAGLSAQLRGTDQVGVAFFGDGAASQGVVHETLNLASLWDLPLVAVVENNRYGEMSGVEEHHAETDLTTLAEPYDVASMDVDGMDVEEVHRAATQAVGRARRGGGPTLLVCETFRFEGHHEGDDGFYRTEEEVERWKRRDPLRTYPAKLRQENVVSEDDVERMRAEARAEVEEAVEFAKESAFPDAEAAYEGLYADEVGS
jgi:pyruvate dehydrogenase E1 component alpha subunit